jgi:serine protease AprX
MRPFRTALAVSVCGVVLAATVVTSAAAGPPGQPGSTTQVIVVAEPGRLDDAQQAIKALGGSVGTVLSIIDGFAGSIASDRIDQLVASGAVATVSPDAEVTPMAVDASLGYDPAETSSLSAVSQITGAQSLWNAGYVGQGVDVALIDTGVSRVAGLDRAGKVIDGPDLSFDSIEPTLVSLDAFGHGTHMAGIIAGSDVAPNTSSKGCSTCLGKSAYTNTTKFVGIAPEARIINVKVGAFDGSTDVSQVIAGIDWVVQHRKDPGINIRVLNLSFGTDSLQSASLDPLVYAAEVAWRSGIVVVAAAGNDGLLTMSVASPALSPTIIAVGASDPVGTIATDNDRVPYFAQHGNSTRTVDFIAPGVSVLSLRVPGSFVDQNVTTGKVGTRFQRASGTSQSTAVVSGLVALLVSKFPTATPDAIKAYLQMTAKPVTLLDANFGSSEFVGAVNSWYSGSGSAYVAGSASMTKLAAVTVVQPTGTGLGTLEGSRGSYHVTNGKTTLTGEKDIFGKSWNASAMSAATSSATTWTGGLWNGARWTGDGWNGARWTNVTWTNNDWAGARWSGARWSSMIWDGARWSGASWSGARWSSGAWEGARWSGARWSDGSWS